MKKDYGLLLVICGSVTAFIMVVITGIYDLIYIAVTCICIDIFYRGIWTPLKEQKQMVYDGNEFLKRHHL